MQTVLTKIIIFSCAIICFTMNSDVVESNTKVPALLQNVHLKKIVRLSPNPSLDGNVVIESFIPNGLSIYLFDEEANLTRQFKLKGNSSYTIHNLKKGLYMYDVFLHEESIENGNIIVK